MSHIPAYVYFIFIGLLWIGIRQCFQRTIRFRRLLITPIIFTALGLHGFFGLFSIPTDIDIGTAVLGLSTGLAFGWHHARSWNVIVNKQVRLITVPGDVMMLVIILSSFAFEFALHYGIESHASWVTTWPIQPIAAGVWAWFLGMSAGRNINLAARFHGAVVLPVSGTP